MTTTEPNPVADMISADLQRRMAHHADAAAAWLPAMCDWLERYVALEYEFEAEVAAHPLGSIDGVFNEVASATTFEQMSGVRLATQNEASRSDSRLKPPRRVEDDQVIDRLRALQGGTR